MFHLTHSNENKEHLFVVVTDIVQNSGEVVIVGITTYDSNKCDKTTILEPGDHPFIKHKSYIFYSGAMFIKVDKIQTLLRLGKAKLKEDISSEVLERIRLGMTKSSHTKNSVYQFFLDKLF